MIFFQWRKLFCVSSVLLCLSSCVDNSSAPQQSDTVETFDFLGMMANYADNIIIPNYQSLLLAAEKLAAEDGELANYCRDLGDTEIPDASIDQNLADAWFELQGAIQRSEMHIFGPVAENSSALLNRLNSYNGFELSFCGIDQAVVLASQNENFDISVRTNNQRGVPAIEYLLFNEDLNHHCPSQITETADWNQRPQLERRQLRCQYAQIIAKDIAEGAAQVLQAWSTEGGNYRLTFINPNNIEDSLKALSDALFYLDVDVKDRKLGIPIGVNDEACSELACADEVESPFAEASLRLIRYNMESFATLFTGGDNLGFDDIIRIAGVPELNTRMLTAIDNVLLFIDGMDTSLKQQAELLVSAEDETACVNALANPSSPSEFPACQLYGLIKVITDDLKVGFVAAVNVDLPERGQADND